MCRHAAERQHASVAPGPCPPKSPHAFGNYETLSLIDEGGEERQDLLPSAKRLFSCVLDFRACFAARRGGLGEFCAVGVLRRGG